ncbi:uncharacterized protein MYCGRDRAFT_110333 [Zymoseptoria tritici IPO323]|uniref:Uncharacterized protein n=1 Tax=Zymoseptoria tritici (strain CBS 115943 / IPO323) TaxID=336722 RepID=F9XI50_ZYMTI|nr:uncharacterized protein MYCGRDRAFT_110333 [Zymoseptoria tritici IPO323]EGP84879.1 hypothetical protein MYCGRDRAFT_110333 [Zymoseptoria tritici IPO323]
MAAGMKGFEHHTISRGNGSDASKFAWWIVGEHRERANSMTTGRRQQKCSASRQRSIISERRKRRHFHFSPLKPKSTANRTRPSRWLPTDTGSAKLLDSTICSEAGNQAVKKDTEQAEDHGS